MAFSARIVGVGDAFTARYYNACLLLEAAGTRLLIDAPPALARALRDLGRGPGPGGEVRLDDIDHVLITHLHGDHVGGLEQLLFYQRFVTGRRTRLHAIPEVLAGLWDTRLRGGMETLLDPASLAASTLTLDDYAEVHPLGPGGGDVGPFQRRLAADPPPHPHLGDPRPRWRRHPRLQRRHRVRSRPHRLARRERRLLPRDEPGRTHPARVPGRATHRLARADAPHPLP